MKVYEPTYWEKFSLWVELENVDLTWELITYYSVCSAWGLYMGWISGLALIGALNA